jgi:hypothetical protein
MDAGSSKSATTGWTPAGSLMDHNPLVILSKALASALLSSPTSRYLTRGRHITVLNSALCPPRWRAPGCTLALDAELLVAELIEVSDADPWPPTVPDRGADGRPDPRGERERGLFLVAALSALGLVSHQGTEGQGRLVRDRGVIARAARSRGEDGNRTR